MAAILDAVEAGMGGAGVFGLSVQVKRGMRDRAGVFCDVRFYGEADLYIIYVIYIYVIYINIYVIYICNIYVIYM